MSRGRCPGCGIEDASCKAVRGHMNDCPEVLAMYRDPERKALVIDPEEEFKRYRTWLASPEGQAELQAQRDERDEKYREEFEGRLAREQERFAGDKASVG